MTGAQNSGRTVRNPYVERGHLEVLYVGYVEVTAERGHRRAKVTSAELARLAEGRRCVELALRLNSRGVDLARRGARRRQQVGGEQVGGDRPMPGVSLRGTQAVPRRGVPQRPGSGRFPPRTPAP
jgi:hypothetical protein